MAKKKLKLLTEQELRVKLEELKTSSDDNIKRMAREFEKALNTGFENIDLVIGAISMVILAGTGMMLVEDLIIILSILGIAIAIIPFNIIKTKLTNQKKFLRGRLKPDETVKRYYAAVDYLLACEGVADTVVLESFLPEDEMEISTEAGMMFTLKSLDLIIPNVCKNAMETGRFDEIHPNLLKMVDRCRTMKDIEYLEKDLSFATLEKYAEIVEAVEKKDEIPRSINRDEIIRRIDKGVSSAKIRAHIKWLKEVYRPAIKAKKKELNSSGVNEHANPVCESINSSIDPDYKKKGNMKLHSLSKKELNPATINRYKNTYKFLSHVKVKNTSGYLYFNNDDLVACIAVETKDDGRWIQAIEITDKYKGYGLSKQLLDVCVSEFKATHLSVNKNNNLAYKIYSDYGFKTYNETDTMYFMTLKTHANESNVVAEAYFKNDEDIYYNREKFDSGEINLCFITGHSGSGKSTMGKNMAGSNIEHYELDDVVANKENFTMENFREYGDLIYSFFSGSGKKYYCTIEECRDGRFKGIDYEKELINDFVNHSIKYAKSHKNTKFVIEGIWLYLNVEPSKLKDCAVYIKGTSAVTSMIRAAKRDWSDATNGLTTIPSKIKWLVNRVTGDNNISKAESAVQKYRSYFSKLVVTESSNISYVNMHPVLEAPQDEDDEDTAEDFTSDVDDDEPDDDDDESAEDFTNDIYDGGESPEDDTAEDDEPEDFTSDAEDDGEPADASEDSEAEPVSDEGDEPVEGEEDVPEDFTDDATGEDETEGGEFDGEEPTEDEDEAPADFTDDVSGEGEETPEDGDEPTVDDTGETTDDMASEDPNEINLDNSSIRNYNLMIDFQKLYKNLEDILTHLNNVSYTTSIQNSVRDRCMDNLTRLKGEVYSYIDQYYSKDFKVNIYYYTTYIQALKINLEMLHKNSVMLDKDSKQ